MSYFKMDHAGWVQEQSRYERVGNPNRKQKDLKSGWHFAPQKLSLFQQKVFDIVGIAFGGIYNAPISWDNVQWQYSREGLLIPVRINSLSSFDSGRLSLLLLLSLEARIRFTIESHGRIMALTFFQRKRIGRMYERSPNVAEFMKNIQDEIPPDHRIFYNDAQYENANPSSDRCQSVGQEELHEKPNES